MSLRQRDVISFAAMVLLTVCGCPSAPPPPPPVAPPTTTSNEVLPAKPTATPAEFLGWAHAALNELENQRYTPAEVALQKILDQRPNDLFATRNLAVSRLLTLESIDAVRDAAAFSAARQRAETAVDKSIELEPRSAVPLILRSRIAKKIGDKEAVLAALERAVAVEPQSAPANYEFYVAIGGASTDPAVWETPAQRAQILAAGRKLDGLQPENWFFLKDWIRDLAAAKEPELKGVLERLRPQIEPFAAVVERDTRANPLKFLDAALTALEQGDFAVAGRSLAPLRNVLLIPEAQYDKGLLDKHPLEFLRPDFDEAFDREVGRPPVETSSAIPVQFTASDVRLPELPGGTARDLAWLDVDLDGQSDLVVLTERQLVALTQPADDAAWQVAYSVEVGEGYQRLFAADLDGDADTAKGAAATTPRTADPDFVLTGPAGLLLVENRHPADGPRTFVPHRDEVPWNEVKNVLAATLADLDHDGDLDLFTSSDGGVRLWAQRGNFQFFEITNRSALPNAEASVTAVAGVDWDRDADLDLLIATPGGLQLLENLRHGRFRNRALGGDFSAAAQASSLVVGDFDANGAWDLFAGGSMGVAWIATERPAGGGLPKAVPTTRLTDLPVDVVSPWDYDNDGFVDLLLTSAQTVQGFRQQQPGKFVPVPELSDVAKLGPTLSADIDRDGDLDLWAGDPLTIWRNDGGNANHWLDVRLYAQEDKGGTQSSSLRANHQGIGSLLELRSGPRYQTAIVAGQSTHFGLGTASQADLLRVLWTNGVPNSFGDPKVDTVVFAEQLPIGSCPYLYTWDGERFVFNTDLLWNAPLGLKFADDVVAGWREWEYLKVDGRFCQPRDGRYELRITEELWEVAYFDQVRLFAVDHPAGTQVFTNEKVGPPDMAAHRIHTVRNPRRPIAARDPHGRDLLATVSRHDGNFTKTYDCKLAAGLANDHYLELDLGDLRGAQRITLFLTGWMYPTDTSLNVQLSQHPTLPRPRPPALWTPDAQGVWREVRPFLGFPGGKTKTIAVDVTDAFTPGDYRLRIATNMEFYWDDVFFTVDEESVEVNERELSLAAAELRYRGFSQAVHRPGNGPETYDYQRVATEPRWPPLSGSYTRYGDVLPLLGERDDQLVVFGAGDEMALSFAVQAEPLQEGWIRDFVLYNVGWDKDAVLNTVHGGTVEPLPFQEMTTYGHLNGEERPRDKPYDRYLRTYQTRRQSPTAFWDFVRRTDDPRGVSLRSRFQSP